MKFSEKNLNYFFCFIGRQQSFTVTIEGEIAGTAQNLLIGQNVRCIKKSMSYIK